MYVSVLFMNETEIRVNQGRGKLKVKLTRIVVDSFFFSAALGSRELSILSVNLLY